MSPPAPIFDHRIFVNPANAASPVKTPDKVVDVRIVRSSSREKVESDATVTSSLSAAAATEENGGIRVSKLDLSNDSVSLGTSDNVEDAEDDDQEPANVSLDNLFDIHAGNDDFLYREWLT